MNILIEAAPGELCDKITILEIKRENIQDEAKLSNVDIELNALLARYTALGRTQSPEIMEQVELICDDLQKVNQEIWVYEDTVRDCEKSQDFGEGFIAAARGIYKANDHRARLKKQINELLGSTIVEEKSYTEY